MADNESPLIKALPPASDYLTYLTIIEYNLTPENLPILHKVLQDETLTTNIGWDLVQLLVPHLPESEQCLQDIARLGNPREVILKVTESLRLIEYEESENDETGNDDAREGADSSTSSTKKPTTDTDKAESETSSPPLAVNQFTTLLSMLAVLHKRVKTKFPSRFLSTTLQAILASFSNATSHREEMAVAIVKTIKTVQGISRPALPSRKSSSMLSNTAPATAPSAADPEAVEGVQPEADDIAIQNRLLQSFVTHVIEEYMLNLTEVDDIPGMAWCSRIMEKLHGDRTIPGSKTFTSRFAEEEGLHRRIDAIGQLVALAQDLELSDGALLTAAVTEEKQPTTDGDEDEPPASADDIPLSRTGSLLLYTARQVSNALYKNTRSAEGSKFEIFPNHQQILKYGLSSPAQGTGTLGTEPAALIDAAVALGLLCLERNDVGEPTSDDQFNEYLQVIALLSSNCPNPNLRGHAHYLTSTVLRCQPDEDARLAFIKDTLEHCPFENLKVSAVGWIKGETIEANPPTPLPGHGSKDKKEVDTSVFATPLALDSLAPYLFPSLHTDLVAAEPQESWMTFQSNISFYLTSLNFLYLLLSAKHLHANLGLASLWSNSDVAGSFLHPLRDASARFKKEMMKGGKLADEQSESAAAELTLLDETVARVTKAVVHLNEA